MVTLITVGFVLGTGCINNRHLRQISAIPTAQNSSKASKLLTQKHRYVRLSTLQQLNSLQWTTAPDAELSNTILTLLEEDSEWCPIRGQAALLLGTWQNTSATGAIVEALTICDDESRYWMLKGLQPLAKADPIALGTIQSLRNDADIFIRNEATQWLEGQ